MNPRVSVPKIFLRGNRWYVRVQVPKSMQKRLKRKEYWVSLKTSDRAEALQLATAATQQKRRDIGVLFRRMEDVRTTITELTDEQIIALGREEFAYHCSDPLDLHSDQKQSGLAWQEYIDTRSEAVKGVVAELRSNRNDIRMTRIRALRLMEGNKIALASHAHHV